MLSICTEEKELKFQYSKLLVMLFYLITFKSSSMRLSKQSYAFLNPHSSTFPNSPLRTNKNITSSSMSPTSSVLLLFRCSQLCLTLCDPMDCSTPGFTISWNLLKLMSIQLVMLYNPLFLCRPLLRLPSIFPSFRVFSNESVLRIRWPKYWSFSFSISPSSEHSGFISFRIDWLDLLAVQETLKHLLQHHSSKASVLWHSAFCMVQLSLPYMTTGKTIALTIRTFVSKVMSLFFNMLSRFVIVFLPRSKCL